MMSSLKASVKAKCQIMNNALPAGTLKIQKPFYVVEDTTGEHMIFCIDQSARLCLIMKGRTGKNELVPLHAHLGLGDGRAVTALAVSQNIDLNINLVCSVRNAHGSDDLFILAPTRPALEAWTDGDTLKGDLCHGEQASITIREIMLGTSNDLLEIFPMVYLTFSHAGSNTEDIWAIDVDAPNKTWRNKKILQMPCNPRYIVSKCVANLKRYRGLLVLYREVKESEQPLQMRFVGYDAAKPNPTLQSITQRVPPDAAHVASFENKKGLTDFLISGKGLHWLKSMDCFKGRNNGGHPVVLDNDAAHSDLEQFFTAQSQDVVSAWSMSKSRVVSYQEYSIPEDEAPMKALTPVIPLLDQEDSKAFSALQHPKLGQKLFVIDNSGSHMKMLEQDTHTATWGRPIDVMIPESDQMIEFQSHTLLLKVTEPGKGPLSNHPILLSSSIDAELIVNGRTIRVSPKGEIVDTDTAGQITVIIISTGLSTPILTLGNPRGQSTFEKPVEVDPMTKLWDEMDKVNSPEDLRKMKMKDGKPFLKPGISDEEVNNALQGLQKLKETRRNLKDKTQKPQSIASRIWGAFKWVASQIASATKWFFEQIDGVWQFVVEVAGKVWKFVLENFPQVAAAIECLLETIAEGAGWLMAKFGKLLGWDDIIDTKNMLVNATTAGMLWGVGIIGELEQGVDKWFEQSKQSVRALKTMAFPAELQGKSIANGQDSLDDKDIPDWVDDDEDGPQSPAANFGMYHFTNSNGHFEGDGEGGPADRILGRLGSLFDEIGKLVEHLMSNIGDAISDTDASFETIIGKIGLDLLEDIIGVFQKLANTIIGSMGDFLLMITDSINTEIQIPVLSPLYRKLTGNELTVLDLACLLLAIPATIVYKIIYDGAAPASRPGGAEWKKKDMFKAELDSRMGRIRAVMAQANTDPETVQTQAHMDNMSIQELSSLSTDQEQSTISALAASGSSVTDAVVDRRAKLETDWPKCYMAILITQDIFRAGKIFYKPYHYARVTWAELNGTAEFFRKPRKGGASKVQSVFKFVKFALWIHDMGSVIVDAPGVVKDAQTDFWTFWDSDYAGERIAITGIEGIKQMVELAFLTKKPVKSPDLRVEYYIPLVSSAAQIPFLLMTQIHCWTKEGKDGYPIWIAVEEWMIIVSTMLNAIMGLQRGKDPNVSTAAALSTGLTMTYDSVRVMVELIKFNGRARSTSCVVDA
ncbi:hypothetical protein AMS68_007589 [Peltaster fructicola]|uniref:Uncharacterized protein n=1 Tax=Peltaster fructicola TaxID=286661 RepID=A0A6H0Y4W2_9PEZI|nr:hypothetical protein AMS68_007589 [Peltaster fructicola]